MARFPTPLIAFQDRFSDEASCAAHLYQVRWPQGFVCPAWGGDRAWSLKGKADTSECRSCHRQTSLTAGTIMPARKLPLRTWFLASFFDGDAFERHFGSATSVDTGARLLPDRLDAGSEAAPGDG